MLTAHISIFDLVGQEVQPVDKLTVSDDPLVHTVIDYVLVLDSQHHIACALALSFSVGCVAYHITYLWFYSQVTFCSSI